MTRHRLTVYSLSASLMLTPLVGCENLPGNAKDSLLYKLITHAKEPHMPYKSRRLTAAEVKQVADWQTQFLAYMREQKPEVRAKLAKERKVGKDLEAELRQAVTDFQPQFKA